MKKLKEILLSRESFGKELAEDERNSLVEGVKAALENNPNSKYADLVSIIEKLPEDVSVGLDDRGRISLLEGGSDIEEKDCKGDVCFSESNVVIAGSEDDDNKTRSVYRLADANVPNNKKSNRASIEILREGSYEHYWYGSIVYNRSKFIDTIENFLNDTAAREISFDFQHQPVYGAAAWLKTLFLTTRVFKDGVVRWILNGSVDYTKMGLDAVTEKRFKYFSIEISDEFSDKETGEKRGAAVLGGGLTNRPFIPGMKAVEFSEDKSGEPAAEFEEKKEFSESANINESVDKKVSSKEGVSTMNLEEQIAELQKKFDAIEDKKSEMAQVYSDQIKTLSEAQENMSKMAKKADDEIQVKLSEQDERLKKLAEDNAHLLAEADKADKERHEVSVELFCKTLSDDNHSPAVVKVVEKHLKASRGELYSFSDGDKKIAVTMKDVVSDILAAIPKDKKVNLSETLAQGGEDAPVNKKDNMTVQFGDNEIKIDDPERIRKNLGKVGINVGK